MWEEGRSVGTWNRSQSVNEIEINNKRGTDTQTHTHKLRMKTKRGNESSKRVCIAVRLWQGAERTAGSHMCVCRCDLNILIGYDLLALPLPLSPFLFLHKKQLENFGKFLKISLWFCSWPQIEFDSKLSFESALQKLKKKCQQFVCIECLAQSCFTQPQKWFNKGGVAESEWVMPHVSTSFCGQKLAKWQLS